MGPEMSALKSSFNKILMYVRGSLPPPKIRTAEEFLGGCFSSPIFRKRAPSRLVAGENGQRQPPEHPPPPCPPPTSEYYKHVCTSMVYSSPAMATSPASGLVTVSM